MSLWAEINAKLNLFCPCVCVYGGRIIIPLEVILFAIRCRPGCIVASRSDIYEIVCGERFFLPQRRVTAVVGSGTDLVDK